MSLVPIAPFLDFARNDKLRRRNTQVLRREEGDQLSGSQLPDCGGNLTPFKDR
jgi:hypothetical protein